MKKVTRAISAPPRVTGLRERNSPWVTTESKPDADHRQKRQRPNGSVFTQGNTTCILNEHGMPVGAYPNSILAWTRVPEDLLQNLQAAVLTDLAVGLSSKRAKSS